MKRTLLYTLLALCVTLGTIALSFSSAYGSGLTRFTLPNGLTVIIKENNARKLVTIQYWVQVGGADENPSQLGISHLMEHMAFKGTPTRGVGMIAKEVEALGGDTNAYTSSDQTVFYVTVPSRAVSQGLEILTDAVFHPAIDPKELEKEKRVVIEEILGKEERPSWKAWKLFLKTAYRDSPHRLPVIGYPETVRKISRDDVIAFRSRWYVPGNMFLVIVGDVDAKKLRPEIERLVGDIKPAPFFHPPRRSEPPQEKARGAVLPDANARETLIYLGFHIPTMKSPDYPALNMAQEILGGKGASRLVTSLEKTDHLVQSVKSYIRAYRDTGLFVVSMRLDGKDAAQALRNTMDQIHRLGREAPSSDEMARALTALESSRLYKKETLKGFARSLGRYELYMGDASFGIPHLRLYGTVTGTEISDVVRRYLRPENAAFAVVTPKANAQDVQVGPLTEIVAAKSAKRSGLSRTPDGDRIITETLPNGIRVVLIPDRSVPVASFTIAHLGGKRYETKDTQGITNFLAQMLTKGAGDMNEEEISRRIKNLGGRLEAFSGYDSFGLQGTFLSRNLTDGLRLMAQISNDPLFPKAPMDWTRKRILHAIKTAPDRAITYALHRLDEALYGSHPYGLARLGTPETVKQITREDLVRTYERFNVSTNTVIAGVGDMDTAEVMALVRTLFGQLPRKDFTEPPTPEREPIRSPIERVIRIPRAKAHIAIGFMAPTALEQDRYPLEVLSTVLGAHSGRLFTELRDKRSLAYTVASFMSPRVRAGLFGFYTACHPDKAGSALEGILNEVQKVQRTGISKQELHAATNKLMVEYETDVQSSWARSQRMALYVLYGLGTDFEKTYARKIREVDAESVAKVARQYLDPARMVAVKILPVE